MGRLRTAGIAVVVAGALAGGCKENANPNCVHPDCTMKITPQSVVPAEGIFEEGLAGDDWSFGYNLNTKQGKLLYQAANGEYVELDLTNVCWENARAQIHMICVSRIRLNRVVTEPATLAPRYCVYKADPDMRAYQENSAIFDKAAAELSRFYEFEKTYGRRDKNCN